MEIKYTKPKDGLIPNITDFTVFTIGASILMHNLGLVITAGVAFLIAGRNFSLGKLNINFKKERK